MFFTLLSSCICVCSRPSRARRAPPHHRPHCPSARTPKDRCVCAERAVSSGDGGADTPVPPPAAPQHPWNCPYHACAPHSPAHRTGARVRIAAQTARASTPGAGRSVSGGGTARRAWFDEHITPPSREWRRLRTAFPPATRCPVHPPLRALPVCEIGRRRACGAHPVRAERGGRDASWRSGRGTYPNGPAARPSDATNTRTDRRASPSPRRAPSACPHVAHALRAPPRSAASRSRESLGAFLRRPVVP